MNQTARPNFALASKAAEAKGAKKNTDSQPSIGTGSASVRRREAPTAGAPLRNGGAGQPGQT